MDSNTEIVGNEVFAVTKESYEIMVGLLSTLSTCATTRLLNYKKCVELTNTVMKDILKIKIIRDDSEGSLRKAIMFIAFPICGLVLGGVAYLPEPKAFISSKSIVIEILENYLMH